jgi:hypothetical protein
VLPTMLEAGDVLNLSIPLDPNADDTSLQKGLLQQTFTHVILKDQDGGVRTYAIPRMPAEGDTRMSLSARVVKR